MCPRTCGCATGWTRTARPPPGPRALAGAKITLSATGWTGHQGLISELREFNERTGITVEFAPDEVRSFTDLQPDEPGRRPDAFIGAALPPWVEAGAMDIRGFVDPETLRSDFGDYLLGAATLSEGGARPADGRVSALPIDVNLKGLVFYPEAAFREAGYEIPTTWDAARRAVSSDRC